MKTIFADFNAITETERVCLTTRGSHEDLQRLGIHVGEWVWLSDGELVVGAEVGEDSRYGVVGIPDWRTLVHLDEVQKQDFPRVRDELFRLTQVPNLSSSDQWRLFQLLTVYESIAPPDALRQGRPGFFSFRRAATLLLLGQLPLAQVEIDEARRLDPGNANDDTLYLEILRRSDLPRAVREAHAMTADSNLTAGLLAECIHVLATHADMLDDGPFQAAADEILNLASQFDRAPGRDQVRAADLALVQFNRWLILLRLGQTGEAQRSLALAHTTNPTHPEIGQAKDWTAYNQPAREIAARIYGRPLAA